jgi:hypothetical protein
MLVYQVSKLSSCYLRRPRRRVYSDNAVKYIGNQPDPHIEIGQRGEEDGKPVFYVKDNGNGIAPEYHERIFGLFNKLDAKAEGTGIGLTLVKRIVEVHGGRVWLESDGVPGKGSTFYFTLPIQLTKRASEDFSRSPALNYCPPIHHMSGITPHKAQSKITNINHINHWAGALRSNTASDGF